jgi:5-oxopent-3-ene-1,2,5-tricarboxylate decarboxylase / 2-hydroxyhepta-2,4-diene-1,7-dioate isomerase
MQAVLTPILATAWPGTVYGVALNDPASLAALGSAVNDAPYKAAPKAPVLYIKPRNTLVGPGSAVVVPADAPALQMGPALAVVVGRTACRVGEADALAHVAGCTVVNDISVPTDSWYRPGLRQRVRDGFCPMARTLATVPDPDALTIRLWIDGQRAFEARTASFARPLARLLADVTAFMTLQPGDVLITGVPHGAPLARAGQRIRIEIPGVGELEHTLVAEAAA